MEKRSSSLDVGLMEEREEFMVSSSKKDRTLMKTQFLKPFVTSIDGLVAELPLPRLSVSSPLGLNNLFSTISFTGFWSPNDHFKSWAVKMETLHEPIWRKAGILEAIKASTYKIPKNLSLISTLVEKWCPDTNSFVFPWGEVTITLEDVMVLLGFSVLGSPVFAPLKTTKMKDAMAKLEKVRKEIQSKDCRVYQEKWILRFRNRCDDQMEHEAFLALWLSHFVFPKQSRPSVLRNVFPIAIRLARGERIALAPAVLASVYRDLGRVHAFARGKSSQNLILKSLFKLVQVWTWERFKRLRPEAREIIRGEPRISRWSGLYQKFENVRLSFDDFEWRPYTKPLRNWNPLRFYVEEAMWVTIDNNLDDEFLAFVRCVRSSRLCGLGFVEDYYPNRVARQFGLAQDLPGLVTRRSNFTEKDAWDHYNKSLDGLKLYMPSRLATTYVTARYRDWWLKSVSKFLGFKESTKTFDASKRDDDAPPKVLPLSETLQKLGKGFPTKLKRRRTPRVARNLKCEIKKGKIGDYWGSATTDLSLNRLFQKELVKRGKRSKRGKRARKEDICYMDFKEEDNITIAQRIKSGKKNGKNDLQRLEDNDLGNKRCKRARDEDDERFMDDKDEEDDDDNITIAQRIRINTREKNGDNACESLVKRSRLEEKDNNDSKICQMFASGDSESVAPQETEENSEEEDEEETRGEKKSSDSPHDDSSGVVVGYEGLKKRKPGIEKLILDIEARLMETKKNVAKIRKWRTRRNQIRSGVSASIVA